jgi:hypothetical protein
MLRLDRCYILAHSLTLRMTVHGRVVIVIPGILIPAVPVVVPVLSLSCALVDAYA